MKKSFTLILALLCLLLCACTERPAAQPTQEPAAQPEVVETAEPAAEPVQPAAEPVQPTAEPVDPAQEAAPSAADTAKALEGESVDELIAAIGEPLSREDYAPSCLGDGEDGIWHYNGFDVYTYRVGDSESVYSVEIN